MTKARNLVVWPVALTVAGLGTGSVATYVAMTNAAIARSEPRA